MQLPDRTWPESFTGEAFDRIRLDAAAYAIADHPRFDEAVIDFCRSVVESFEGHWLANRLMSDAARFALTAMIIVQDAAYRNGSDAEGATIAKLVELLGIRKLASPGRVKAMVALLRMAGAVERAPSPSDRRKKRLQPTDLLMGQAVRWLERNLISTEIVTPLPAPVGMLVASREFIDGYFQTMAVPYINQGFILYDGLAEVEELMSHTGGYLIMLELARTAQSTPEGVVLAEAPSGPLAKRLMISRSQAGAILRLAERRGWLSLRARGGWTVELAPAFHRRIRHWLAREMVWSADMARRAWAQRNDT